jgi:biopolymer transport protein ExbB
MISAILLQVMNNANTVVDTTKQAVQSVPVVAALPTESSISVWDMVLKGGPLMWPLGLLTIIAVYIFIERYLVIRKASKTEDNFLNNIRDSIYSGRIDSAVEYCRRSITPTARLVEKGIKRLGKPLKEIEDSIEIVGKFEVYKLEKNMAILSIIAGIAPMFGFVGTIIGVIKIFHDISLAGDVSITSVSSGLYVKMVSSAAGLLIGMFAFICFHWLNIMINRQVQKMEQDTMEFIDMLQEPVK